jgi:pimeloyl-ACP methyl ester carboxylesterase
MVEPAVIGGAYHTVVTSRGPTTRASVDSETAPPRCEAKLRTHPSSRRKQRKMKRNVTGAVFPCGHWVAEESPELLLEHLLPFLA